MTGPKLYYFDAAGRAEMIRLAFALGQVPYEDVRIPRATWPGEHKAKSPTGVLPYLEFEDGTKICEALAILMYAAVLAGLVPTDPIQAAYADQAVSLLFSLPAKMQAMAADREAGFAAFKAHCEMINNVIGQTQSANGHVVGSKLSYADVAIYCFLRQSLPQHDADLANAALGFMPNLKRVCDVVAAEPRVKAHYGF